MPDYPKIVPQTKQAKSKPKPKPKRRAKPGSTVHVKDDRAQDFDFSFSTLHGFSVKVTQKKGDIAAHLTINKRSQDTFLHNMVQSVKKFDSTILVAMMDTVKQMLEVQRQAIEDAEAAQSAQVPAMASVGDRVRSVKDWGVQGIVASVNAKVVTINLDSGLTASVSHAEFYRLWAPAPAPN